MKIACIGECMVEVSEATDRSGKAHMRFGGDTLNTAIYLARLLKADDMDVHYVTRLGDDPYSDHMVSAWRAEGIHCEHVEQVPGREAGLYAIDVDATGERNFTYWRSNAPARELFEGEAGAALIEKLSAFDVIYFSGITLAILLPESRKRLLALAGRMKSEGRMVAYDTNYRARLWADGDEVNANTEALNAATLALPSSEDMVAIFNGNGKNLLEGFSCPEVVLKHGGDDLDIYEGEIWQRVALDKMARPLDTTAAGDSFNAGYLAARLQDGTPEAAAHHAHMLACAVIAQPGAIIPLSAMPKSANAQQPAAREA